MPIEAPKRRSFIEVLILSTIFGFGAGAVGMLVVAGYLLPEPYFSSSVFQVSRSVGGTTLGSEQVVDGESAVRAAVLIFTAKPESDDPLKSAYLPSDALAAGVVLTSDGWILSHGDAAAKSAGKGVAVVGGRAYGIGESIADPFTGIVFLKVEGANLPVTAFGDESTMAPGSPVFSFDVAGGLRRIDVIAIAEQPPKTVDDLLRSSERMEKTIRLSDASDVRGGAMVINRSGELVGIFAGKAVVGSTAVPLSAFSRQIGAVLRGKGVIRPYLGVRYVDLSHLMDGAVRRGALISASTDGKIAAVAKKSPAEAAGLRSGDVITAVNGEEVTGNRALADLLAEYEPGSAVSFTVQRRETVRTVSAVLEISQQP